MVYYFLIQDISSQTNSEGIIAQLPSMQSMKSSLYRTRRERLPPMPRSCAELNLTSDWAKMLDGQDFVLANDGQDEKKLFCLAQSPALGFCLRPTHTMWMGHFVSPLLYFISSLQSTQ